MRRNVFLSYSSRNRREVRVLADDMRRLGHTVWLDAELSGGQSWWMEILAQIERCDVFLFAVSQGSVRSDACQREVRWARDLGRPIVPVRISGDVPDVLLPSGLASLQLVDYRRPSRASGFDLAKALDALPSSSPHLQQRPIPPGPPAMSRDQSWSALRYACLALAAITSVVTGGWLLRDGTPAGSTKLTPEPRNETRHPERQKSEPESKPAPSPPGDGVATTPPAPGGVGQAASKRVTPGTTQLSKSGPVVGGAPAIQSDTPRSPVPQQPSAPTLKVQFEPDLAEVRRELEPTLEQLKMRVAKGNLPPCQVRAYSTVKKLGMADGQVLIWWVTVTVDVVRSDTGALLSHTASRRKRFSGENEGDAVSHALVSISGSFLPEVRAALDAL